MIQMDAMQLDAFKKSYQNPMAVDGDSGKEGVWLSLPKHDQPVYVTQQPHIRRLTLEHGAQIVPDPRPALAVKLGITTEEELAKEGAKVKDESHKGKK